MKWISARSCAAAGSSTPASSPMWIPSMMASQSCIPCGSFRSRLGSAMWRSQRSLLHGKIYFRRRDRDVMLLSACSPSSFCSHSNCSLVSRKWQCSFYLKIPSSSYHSMCPSLPDSEDVISLLSLWRRCRGVSPAASERTQPWPFSPLFRTCRGPGEPSSKRPRGGSRDSLYLVKYNQSQTISTASLTAHVGASRFPSEDGDALHVLDTALRSFLSAK